MPTPCLSPQPLRPVAGMRSRGLELSLAAGFAVLAFAGLLTWLNGTAEARMVSDRTMLVVPGAALAE